MHVVVSFQLLLPSLDAITIHDNQLLLIFANSFLFYWIKSPSFHEHLCSKLVWIVLFEKTARWNVTPPPTPHLTEPQISRRADKWRERKVWAGKGDVIKKSVGWKISQKSWIERWTRGIQHREIINTVHNLNWHIQNNLNKKRILTLAA